MGHITHSSLVGVVGYFTSLMSSDRVEGESIGGTGEVSRADGDVRSVL